MVWPAGHDVSSPADAAERAFGVHTASVHTREVQCDASLTLVYIYTCHGGHVQFVSMVTVTGVTLGDADTPAILAAM